MCIVFFPDIFSLHYMISHPVWSSNCLLGIRSFLTAIKTPPWRSVPLSLLSISDMSAISIFPLLWFFVNHVSVPIITSGCDAASWARSSFLAKMLWQFIVRIEGRPLLGVFGPWWWCRDWRPYRCIDRARRNCRCFSGSGSGIFLHIISCLCWINRNARLFNTFSHFIHHFHRHHNAPCLHSKIWYNHCFQFLLGIAVVSREIEDDGYAKFRGVNKAHSYGLGENSEYVVTCMWKMFWLYCAKRRRMDFTSVSDYSNVFSVGFKLPKKCWNWAILPSPTLVLALPVRTLSCVRLLNYGCKVLDLFVAKPRETWSVGFCAITRRRSVLQRKWIDVWEHLYCASLRNNNNNKSLFIRQKYLSDVTIKKGF